MHCGLLRPLPTTTRVILPNDELADVQRHFDDTEFYRRAPKMRKRTERSQERSTQRAEISEARTFFRPDVKEHNAGRGPLRGRNMKRHSVYEFDDDPDVMHSPPSPFPEWYGAVTHTMDGQAHWGRWLSPYADFKTPQLGGRFWRRGEVSETEISQTFDRFCGRPESCEVAEVICAWMGQHKFQQHVAEVRRRFFQNLKVIVPALPLHGERFAAPNGRDRHGYSYGAIWQAINLLPSSDVPLLKAIGAGILTDELFLQYPVAEAT